MPLVQSALQDAANKVPELFSPQARLLMAEEIVTAYLAAAGVTVPPMNSTERDLPEHAFRDKDHKRIWLSPACDDERTWCQDDQGPCDDCGLPSVEYVRADALASIRAERDAAVAALEPFANWPGHRPAAADETAVWTVTVHSKEQSGLTFADFRAARAIAGEQKP